MQILRATSFKMMNVVIKIVAIKDIKIILNLPISRRIPKFGRIEFPAIRNDIHTRPSSPFSDYLTLKRGFSLDLRRANTYNT